MFFGIISATATVISHTFENNLSTLTLSVTKEFTSELNVGASIAVDGTCLSVVSFATERITFNCVQESLNQTNLALLTKGASVHVERSARLGAEIGGHLLSGHISCTATLDQINRQDDYYIMTLSLPKPWIKYVFNKGYIAINGVSLTITDVHEPQFSLHIIPETLRATLLGQKKVGDKLNVEFDSTTVSIVDTLRRLRLTLG